MYMTKKSILLNSAAVVLVILGVAAPNSALAQSYGVDMNAACQITLNAIGARAELKYQNAWGWRCYIPGTFISNRSVNVQRYCSEVFGLNAYALDPSNPYSWVCQ